MNSRVKTLWGEKPCVFLGKVASMVAEGGSLFPRMRASIWENRRQKVRRTVARAHMHFKIMSQKNGMLGVHARSTFRHFWKMRSAKCARDCSESARKLTCTSVLLPPEATFVAEGVSVFSDLTMYVRRCNSQASE